MPANDDIRDATLRHQVHIRRVAKRQAREALELLEAADRDVVKLLREELKKLLAAGGDPNDSRTVRRLKGLLKEIRRERERAMRALAAQVKPEMIDFGKIEGEFEIKVMDRSIPIAVDLPKVTPGMVEGIVNTQPFNGRTLGEWFESLREADQRRLLEQIRVGVLEGQSIPNIVRRVAGTRRGQFRDGILATTRRQAEAIVRTAVNGISNAVRNRIWDRFGGAVEGLVWSAVLDGRTTPVCRGRDGHVRPVSLSRPLPDSVKLPRLKPPLASPPAHVSCRSVLVAYIGEDLIGDQPFVRDTRTRRVREIDFRKQAKEKAGPNWKGLSEKERRARIADERREWSAENIGRIPAKVDYDEWLRDQPADFQDDVLGKTKGKLFRGGKVKLDEFIDINGDELTLDELRQLHPDIFDQAGV